MIERIIVMNKRFFTALALVGASTAALAGGEGRIIGETDTAFKFLGKNDRLLTVAFDDPEIRGATCYLTRAVKGGLSGAVGMAEDKSDASIACRQTGPMYAEDLNQAEKGRDGEVVFNANLSPLFKDLTVTRYFDSVQSSYVYVTTSTKLVDGSPKNSTSAIVPQVWNPLFK